MSPYAPHAPCRFRQDSPKESALAEDVRLPGRLPWVRRKKCFNMKQHKDITSALFPLVSLVRALLTINNEKTQALLWRSHIFWKQNLQKRGADVWRYLLVTRWSYIDLQQEGVMLVGSERSPSSFWASSLKTTGLPWWRASQLTLADSKEAGHLW